MTAPKMTPFQRRKREKDKKIYNDWLKAIEEDPNRSRTEVIRYLQQKYGFCSDTGIYRLLRREEQRRIGMENKTLKHE